MSDPYQLMQKAHQARDPLERFELLSEAVRLADLQGDEETGYETRDELLDAAQEIGDAQTLLITFAWMLKYADEHPEDIHEGDLLWRHKWALAVCRFLPSVPLERIQALQDDFARRTTKANLGERTANIDRWRLALHVGDLEEAERWRERVKSQRGRWLDCDACDTDLHVEHLLQRGDLDGAMKAALPLFSGKQVCNRMPARTHSRVLVPLWRAGRFEEAEKHHKKGYKLVKGDLDSLREQAAHLLYLALSGNDKAARKVHAENLKFARSNTTPSDLLDWHAACAAAEAALEGPLSPDDEQDHAALARELAARFDRRNGTTAHSDRLEALLKGKDT